MKKLKDFNKNAHSWMIEHAESRDKPLITMLELIRFKFMETIKDRSTAMSKKLGPLCVKIKKILDDDVKDSVGYTIKWNGRDGFEVKAQSEQFTIDIVRMTCNYGPKKLRERDKSEIVKKGKTKRLKKCMIAHCSWCRQTCQNIKKCPTKQS
ncbi:hypothetical protein LIER_29481 [Lithospermum erythrorhizon]|uniref:Uncharacterized protein n=1 Tax=Lithospermum erythrorhizon TaxID=34254 RepID=A0AAV3RQ90_LITER